MDSHFQEQTLAEKLSTLKSSQQSIETLSHWCISHRRKAEIVVATWDKQFHSSQMVQKIPLLYLANDILQNSKHTANEFVSEFWKVLPGALKDIIEKATDPKRKTLSKDLEGEENVLKASVEKLKVVEANRKALVSQLQEALHEQESELENVRMQMQVALARADESCKMRRRLNDNHIAVAQQSNTFPPPMDTSTKGGQQPKKSAAATAAEVADRLAACASFQSQSIMASVLSTFVAEEAKNAGLAMSSSAFWSFLAPSVNRVSNLPSTAPPSDTHQSLLVQQPMLQLTQTRMSSQTRYHMVTTPSPQHNVQPSGVMVNSYSHVFPPLPPGPPPQRGPPPPPPPPPQTHMQLQITQQQPSVSTTQQLPAPPSFRPVGLFQPPGMVYHGRPYQSS